MTSYNNNNAETPTYSKPFTHRSMHPAYYIPPHKNRVQRALCEKNIVERAIIQCHLKQVDSAK